jgi:hypothetical protein
MEAKRIWGFLRETKEKARKDGIDLDTGIPRTGLDEYLSEIFPSVNDWINNQVLSEIPGCRKRPDYFSKQLGLIIEFDGIQHYQSPRRIRLDLENIHFYQSHGYKVVRIPYFIQLTRSAIKEFFGVDVGHKMFDEKIPSLGPLGDDTPAFLCHQGIVRMANEFLRFPEQYQVNLDFLKKQKEELQYLIEYESLEIEYLKG